MDININLTFKDKRCVTCGRFYYIEYSLLERQTCPYCAASKLGAETEKTLHHGKNKK